MKRSLILAISLSLFASHPSARAEEFLTSASSESAANLEASCAADSCTDLPCAVGSESCCDPCCCDPCCGPRFYTQAEALFFNRDTRLANTPAVIRVTNEANAFPGATVLTFGSVGGANDVGVRGLIGWYVDDCRAWEASYFGLWNLGGGATATATNNLAIPGDLGLASLDFFAADTITLNYNSQLNNAELNHRWLRTDNFSLLAGFRYLSLDESLNMQATDSDSGTSNYNVATRNDLFGGQIGARYQKQWNRLGFDTTGKVGIFYNDASQTQFVQDFPPGFFLRNPTGSSTDNVAFVADFNFSLTYQVTDRLYLRGGYNLIFIEGVATAPGQFDFTDTAASGTTTNFNGLLLHGVNVGLEGRF